MTPTTTANDNGETMVDALCRYSPPGVTIELTIYHGREHALRVIVTRAAATVNALPSDQYDTLIKRDKSTR